MKMQNNAKGFWALIGGMIVAGIAYLAASKKLIDWLTGLITGRRNDN